MPTAPNGGQSVSLTSLVDSSGNFVSVGSGGATGPGTAATAQRVTYASDGATLPVKAASYTQLGYQQITAATLASSTAMTVPGGSTTAIVQNNTSQPARFRPDGATTAPTASVGQRLLAAGTLTLDIGNAGLTSTRFILEAAGTGTFDITYYS